MFNLPTISEFDSISDYRIVLYPQIEARWLELGVKRVLQPKINV